MRSHCVIGILHSSKNGSMIRSTPSGGVLAGTDEPLMFGLAFPTGYLEQCN